MKPVNRAARKYCRQVRSWLPGGKLRRPVMEQLYCAVNDYTLQNPRANFSALELHFGSPKAVAAAYVKAMDTKEVLRSLRLRQRILALVISAVLLLSIAWTAHNIYNLYRVYIGRYDAYSEIYYE